MEGTVASGVEGAEPSFGPLYPAPLAGPSPIDRINSVVKARAVTASIGVSFRMRASPGRCPDSRHQSAAAILGL